MKKNRQNLAKLPEGFLERLQQIVGVSLSTQIQQTFVERPTTFRVNTIKAERNEVRQVLFDLGFKTDNVVWYKDAFILKNKSQKELEATDLYQQGKIYLQSLASMVPPLVLDPQPDKKVLDLTAAPGSKTSQIAALMSDPDGSVSGGELRGELVANDIDKVRFQKLKHNLELLGVLSKPHPNPPLQVEGNKNTPFEGGKGGVGDWQCTIHNEPGTKLVQQYANYFDKILLDAPCTAEARVILGKPATFGFWQERNIKDTAYLQRQLLFSAWQMLKPGGILVYSTCTFAPEENEVQITKFIERNVDCEILPIAFNVDKLLVVKEWKEIKINKDVIKNALRLTPTKEIEGFFVVKLRKVI